MSDQTIKAEPPPAAAAPKTLAVQISEAKGRLEKKLLSEGPGGFLDDLNKIAAKGTDVRMLCNQLIRETADKDPEKLLEVMKTKKGLMSIIDCAVRAARVGFQFDGQQAYPVPFRVKGTMVYQFVPGYKGWVLAMNEQPEVASVDAQLVYSNDKFKLDLMQPEKSSHIPALDDRGEVVSGYMIARMVKGGAPVIYPMDRKQLDAAVVGTSDAWQKHPEAMWIATLFRRGHNKVPMRPGSRLSTLSEISSEVDRGAGTDLARSVVMDSTSHDDGDGSGYTEPEVMPE